LREVTLVGMSATLSVETCIGGGDAHRCLGGTHAEAA
jgi:hypothetical protein